MKDRYDLLSQKNEARHSNIRKYGLTFPDGLTLVDDLVISADDTRLPKDVYLSRERLGQEIEKVWKRSWNYVCRDEEVSLPGDIYVYDITDQSFLVVRQIDGSLKAYHNVCLHRGTRLLDDNCSSRSITCPFHRWSWNIDGRLRSIPDAGTFCDVKNEDYGLRAVSVESWAGFIFIHADPGAQPALAEFLGVIPKQLDIFNMQDMRIVHNSIMQLSANWKTAIEAFIETYHVQGIHRQLLYAHDPINSPIEILSEDYGHSRTVAVFGVPGQQISSYNNAQVIENYAHCAGLFVGRDIDSSKLFFLDDHRHAESIPDHDGLAAYPHARAYLIERACEELIKRGIDSAPFLADELVDDYHYFIFPGLVINVAAGGVLLIRVKPHTTDPDQCFIQTTILHKLPPELEKDRKPPALVTFKEAEGLEKYPLVLQQDYSNIPRTQRGLHSDGLDKLTVSKQEVRIIALHRALDRLLAKQDEKMMAPAR